MVLDFLAVDNFDFTRKIVKKKFCEKLVKMLGFCQDSIFGQKFDFSNSVKKEKREIEPFLLFFSFSGYLYISFFLVLLENRSWS